MKAFPSLFQLSKRQEYWALYKMVTKYSFILAFFHPKILIFFPLSYSGWKPFTSTMRLQASLSWVEGPGVPRSVRSLWSCFLQVYLGRLIGRLHSENAARFFIWKWSFFHSKVCKVPLHVQTLNLNLLIRNNMSFVLISVIAIE